MTHFTRRGLELVPADLAWEGWLPRMADAGLNLLVVHEPHSARALADFARSPRGGALYAASSRVGIDLEWAPHALRDLLPREEFAAHPDWFRGNEAGERVPDWNLCPSSAGAREVVAASAAALARQLVPTTHRYYFWANDGRPWCHCPRCAGLCAADQNLLVMNGVLDGVRTVDGQARLSDLAYLQTFAPPESVRPAAGLFLECAPIQRCPLHALDDGGCATNRAELARLRHLLAGWSILDGAQVLEYWLDESWFWRAAGRPEDLPRLPFCEDVLRRDLALYAELGFRSVVSYAVMLGRDYVARHGEPPVKQYGEATLATASL